jgi:hypothetical protein
MILHINDSRMLRELQLDLSRYYPYLRMEFYPDEKSTHNLSPNGSKIDPYVKTGSVRKHHHAGAINILPGTTIKAFTTQMKNDYNLYVQLLHYTKEGWMPADDITLYSMEELNQQGREIFHEVNNVAGQLKNLL